MWSWYLGKILGVSHLSFHYTNIGCPPPPASLSEDLCLRSLNNISWAKEGRMQPWSVWSHIRWLSKLLSLFRLEIDNSLLSNERYWYPQMLGSRGELLKFHEQCPVLVGNRYGSWEEPNGDIFWGTDHALPVTMTCRRPLLLGLSKYLFGVQW